MDKATVSSVMNSLNLLFPNEPSIVISDLKRFIYYRPSKQIDLQILPGDDIHENTVTYNALQQQQRVAEQKNSDLFGTSYYGVSVPITEEGILKGAMTAVFRREPLGLITPFLTVKVTDRWLPIHFDKVVYLEAQIRKTFVLSTVGEGTHKYNLTELEYILPTDTFIRCHRSYIININHIKEIHPDSHSTFILIMNDQSKVPVSQSYARNFRKTFRF